MLKSFTLSFAFILFLGLVGFSQDDKEGNFHGNLQLDAQTYGEDSVIGAEKAEEVMLTNIYANFTYTKGNFSAGARFEGYMNSLQGYLPVNEGVGFPFAYLNYKEGNLDVTVGSFYEQFGSGLVFRTYADKLLGYDNAMNGILLKYKINNGVYLKGVYGQQRLSQQIINDRAQLVLGRGIVRGIDAEFALNEMFSSLANKKTMVTIGGSFVSKFEIDDNPVYFLPQNVAAGAGRINVNRGKIQLMAEYVFKSQDPSAGGTDNSNGNVGQSYIYKNGQGAIMSATYSQKGFGVFLMAKSVDNMNFRSERNAKLGDLSINYIPDITKSHTYSLAAFYPYGTQPNGEAGIQSEVFYKFKKGSKFGGKYGTNISLSLSRMFSLVKEQYNDTISLISNDGTMGYRTSLLAFGDELFFQDINLEVNKKFTKKFSGIFTIQSLTYDNAIIHGAAPNEPLIIENVETVKEVEENIKAITVIADINYKFASNKSLRTELQHLATKQNKGNWAMILFEYSIPNWFFVISDQYNYGNEYSDLKVHYYNSAVVYNHGATRFQLGYGKQRAGVVCTGGVCRQVPSANGITFSITSSF